MTTTTSTTSSTSTASTSSIVSSAANEVLTSLGTGSGIDTSSLVTSLVTAQFATKSAALSTKAETLTSQISGVSTLKNAMSTFATAVETLAKGGTLVTQPVSSNSSVLSASALSGAKVAGLNSTIAVSQLASAQTAVSASAFASSTATVGTGTLTLTFGEATYNGAGTAMTAFTAGSATPVTIDITDGSLDKVAAAINAKKAGVTASVVTDADGTAYLSLKSTTGKAQAFTLEATTSATGDLSRIAVGPGSTATTMTSVAKNAKLTVDGVAVERASNSISDLVTGVKLDLAGTSTTAVSLTSTTPTTALANAVNDFVDTYNEVMALVEEQTNITSGALKSDTAAKALLASLKGLTQKSLATAATGVPTTLAGIGVRTTKTGTLEVDTTALEKAMTNTPDAVEAMFAYSTDASSGISAVLKSLSLRTSSTVYGLGLSGQTYTAAQSDVTEAQEDLATAKTDATTRMTAQFSSMNSKVTAYKNTQSYLTQQIAAWDSDD